LVVIELVDDCETKKIEILQISIIFLIPRATPETLSSIKYKHPLQHLFSIFTSSPKSEIFIVFQN